MKFLFITPIFILSFLAQTCLVLAQDKNKGESKPSKLQMEELIKDGKFRQLYREVGFDDDYIHSLEEVQQTYRNKTKEIRASLIKASPAEKSQLMRELKEVNSAYNIFKDEGRKKFYDSTALTKKVISKKPEEGTAGPNSSANSKEKKFNFDRDFDKEAQEEAAAAKKSSRPKTAKKYAKPAAEAKANTANTASADSPTAATSNTQYSSGSFHARQPLDSVRLNANAKVNEVVLFKGKLPDYYDVLKVQPADLQSSENIYAAYRHQYDALVAQGASSDKFALVEKAKTVLTNPSLTRDYAKAIDQAHIVQADGSAKAYRDVIQQRNQARQAQTIAENTKVETPTGNTSIKNGFCGAFAEAAMKFASGK